MAANAAPEQRYHHGDLRNALIVAAAELIIERGVDGFAMVDAARRAGVSSAAPYRHFKHKDALLHAVTELAGMELKRRCYEILEEQTPGTRECVIALGHCYVSFVMEHRAFYDLMWGDQLNSPDPEGSDAQRREGFGIFVSSVARWCEQQHLDHTDPLDLAVKLWSFAHGLAGLAMNHQYDRFVPDADPEQMLRSMVHSMLDGIELAEARQSGQEQDTA